MVKVYGSKKENVKLLGEFEELKEALEFKKAVEETKKIIAWVIE